LRARSLRFALALLFVTGVLACAGPRSTVSPGGGAPALLDPFAALEAAQANLAKNPEDPELLFQVGLAWQARAEGAGDTLARAYLDSARVAYDAALVREPTHVKALVHSGLVLEDLGQTDAALARYTEATEVAPDDPRPFVNLGALLYFQSKRIYDAKVALTRALELDPTNADARFNLGVLFADAALFREARTEWEKVAQGTDGAARQLALQNLEKIRPLLVSQDSALAAAAAGGSAVESTPVAPGAEGAGQ
jgi:tetratricopeptide (TPR) repeat protein